MDLFLIIVIGVPMLLITFAVGFALGAIIATRTLMNS